MRKALPVAAQRSLLGACLLDNSRIPKLPVARRFTGEWRIIQEAMVGCYYFRPCDLVTLAASLRSVTAFDAVGGHETLRALIKDAPNSKEDNE